MLGPLAAINTIAAYSTLLLVRGLGKMAPTALSLLSRYLRAPVDFLRGSATTLEHFGLSSVMLVRMCSIFSYALSHHVNGDPIFTS